MKVSVPSSYSAPGKVLELRSVSEPSPESIPSPEPEQRPSLPLLSADWWQSFLHGNADALLARVDVQRALDLIANKLGKEADQPDTNGSIRSSQLRKMIYARFGADLALYTMEALWREASAGGEQSNTATAQDMPEPVARFFAPESPTPPWRWESVEDRLERERRAGFGGWCG
jgi:hypothetical protein